MMKVKKLAMKKLRIRKTKKISAPMSKRKIRKRRKSRSSKIAMLKTIKLLMMTKMMMVLVTSKKQRKDKKEEKEVMLKLAAMLLKNKKILIMMKRDMGHLIKKIKLIIVVIKTRNFRVETNKFQQVSHSRIIINNKSLSKQFPLK